MTFYKGLIISNQARIDSDLQVGDIINGVGIPFDSIVVGITELLGAPPNADRWRVEIDKTPIEGEVYTIGNHDTYTNHLGQSGTRNSWDTSFTILKPSLPKPILSFSEKAGGWISFKSFGAMDMGISLANDYYTFNNGDLFLHHQEGVGRNTFYGNFLASTIDVILNQDPGSVKVFNTLNYEGSQSKVNKFENTTLNLAFQNARDYNDQEYYNLQAKSGWHVYSINTNKEEGYVREFLEKEGKWFNGINKLVDTEGVVDTSDFTFQGIGVVSQILRLEVGRPLTQIGWTLALNLKRLNVSLQVGDYIYNRTPEQQLVPGSAGTLAAYDPRGGITEDDTSLEDLQGKSDLVGVLRRISQEYFSASDSYEVVLDIEAVDNDFSAIDVTAEEVSQFLMFSKYNQSMGNVIGYYAKAKFVNDSSEKAEIFSVGSEIIINSK